MTEQSIAFNTSEITVRYTEYGAGAPMLLLHGGGGPATVTGFGEQYAATHNARVIVPVHPGFDGTQRPAALDSTGGLAQLYGGLLDALGLDDVTVVGNSLGGWITAEMALLAGPGVGRYVIADAVGLELPEAPIADFFALTMDQVVELSFFRPENFRMDVDALPDVAKQVMAGNRAALHVYGGDTMADPTLRARLSGAAGPSLVVWGAADRIVAPAHGEVFAAELPDAGLVVIPDAGHLPQLETPDTFATLIANFVGGR